MPGVKTTGPSSLDGVLNSLLRENKITRAELLRIREAAIRESSEVAGVAVENALLKAKEENERMRQEKERLARDLETRLEKAHKDMKAGGTITKEHFETETLPTYVRELCRSHRGIDRRTTWPILHFMDGTGFGTYNKMWNQVVGDQIIEMMGKALLRAVRSRDSLYRQCDFVAHVGGDEFCVLETDAGTIHHGYDSQGRFRHYISTADWRKIRETLALMPPQMDIGGVSIKSSSLRGQELSEEQIRYIAGRWYELGSIAMKRAKKDRSNVLDFVQYDKDLGDFVDVPRTELRYALENRKGP